jgi:hypothetical protein
MVHHGQPINKGLDISENKLISMNSKHVQQDRPLRTQNETPPRGFDDYKPAQNLEIPERIPGTSYGYQQPANKDAQEGAE